MITPIITPVIVRGYTRPLRTITEDGDRYTEITKDFKNIDGTIYIKDDPAPSVRELCLRIIAVAGAFAALYGTAIGLSTYLWIEFWAESSTWRTQANDETACLLSTIGIMVGVALALGIIFGGKNETS